MADAVASQTLFDGERVAIMKFTNISDGTGENKVVKVNAGLLNPSASGAACNGVTINKIHASTHGMEVQIYWDATTDVLCWIVPQNSQYTWDWEKIGGLVNNSGAGKNGNVLFSTVDASTGDMYSIVLEMVKSYASV
ncbi:MAG: hypothetical protein FGM60_04665 [Candidatus Planktophila sp.]|nr:hypothetical protein [Candidatus Planktophila sp.]